jgi:2-methylcitrate dehydratase PrpD
MDRVIAGLQDKVVGEAEVSPYAERGGGTVTITTRDGRVHSRTFQAPRGSGPRGIEWTDIAAKYRSLAPLGGLSPQKVEQSLEAIRRFEDAQGVSALTRLLRPNG